MQSFKQHYPSVTLWRYDSDDGYFTQEEALHPSELMDRYERFDENHTKKLTDLLDERVKQLIEDGYHFSLNSPYEVPSADNYPEQRSSGRIRQIVSDLIADTLDYAGGFEFEEQAFDAAFDDTILPLYSHSVEIDYVIPVSGLDGSFAPVELPPHECDRENGSSCIATFASDLELGPLTDSELSGIWTVDSGLNSHPFTSYVQGSPSELGVHARIRGTIHVEDRSEEETLSAPSNVSWANKGIGLMHDEAERILKMLRLYGPEQSSVKLGHVFILEAHWLAYRENIEYLPVRRSVPDPWVRGPLKYQFDDEDAVEFREYWEKYVGMISDSNISQPIRRFHQAFEKDTPEDSLIDTFLGFESSLMKGSESSYTFRLPGRATLLPADQVDEPRFVYEFFRALRKCRNEILHSDSRIDHITPDNMEKLSDDLRDDGDLDPHEFTVQAEVFLSKILLTYMDLMDETSMNIHQINTEILEPEMRDLVANPRRSSGGVSDILRSDK